LDLPRFKQCVESGKFRQEVQEDYEYGLKIGVNATPTTFINGNKLVGVDTDAPDPFESFKAAIDAELDGRP
jgi:protein-disulfide isomerase